MMGLDLLLLRRREVLDAARDDVLVGEDQAFGGDQPARGAADPHRGEPNAVEPRLVGAPAVDAL